jgi:transposase
LRLQRTSQLMDEELNELVEAVRAALHQPWHAGTGRPKALSLAEAVEATVIYLRRNLVQEVIGEMFRVHQAVISRTITAPTPMIAAATAPHVPTLEQAHHYVKGATVLLDGTLAPLWSWAGHRELRSGKHKTTGFNIQLVADRVGTVLYVAGPIEGCAHDLRAMEQSGTKALLQAAATVVADKGYRGSGYLMPRRKPDRGHLTQTDHEYNAQVSSLRAPIERAIANLKVWRVLHTDYRRPLRTFLDTFHAVIGLHFFKETFA